MRDRKACAAIRGDVMNRESFNCRIDPANEKPRNKESFKIQEYERGFIYPKRVSNRGLEKANPSNLNPNAPSKKYFSLNSKCPANGEVHTASP
jgi:hypothetical protein